jgi:hypothetical protein
VLVPSNQISILFVYIVMWLRFPKKVVETCHIFINMVSTCSIQSNIYNFCLYCHVIEVPIEGCSDMSHLYIHGKCLFNPIKYLYYLSMLSHDWVLCCRKTMTNFITLFCMEYTSPEAELTTDCINKWKSNHDWPWNTVKPF